MANFEGPSVSNPADRTASANDIDDKGEEFFSFSLHHSKALIMINRRPMIGLAKGWSPQAPGRCIGNQERVAQVMSDLRKCKGNVGRRRRRAPRSGAKLAAGDRIGRALMLAQHRLFDLVLGVRDLKRRISVTALMHRCRRRHSGATGGRVREPTAGLEGDVNDRRPGLVAQSVARSAIAGALMSLAATWLSAVAWASDPVRCQTDDYRDVRIGDQWFRVPLRYMPSIRYADPKHPLARRDERLPICTGASDEVPIFSAEADSISILFHRMVPLDGFPLGIHPINVILAKTGDFSVSENSVEIARRTREERGLAGKPLPREGQFWGIPNATGQMDKYIAMPGTLETPDGYRIFFSCQPDYMKSFLGDYVGRLCTVKYQWRENVSLKYSFSDGIRPIGDFDRLDKATRNFVHSLEIVEHDQD